jgi:hypothetical protein
LSAEVASRVRAQVWLVMRLTLLGGAGLIVFVITAAAGAADLATGVGAGLLVLGAVNALLSVAPGTPLGARGFATIVLFLDVAVARALGDRGPEWAFPVALGSLLLVLARSAAAALRRRAE